MKIKKLAAVLAAVIVTAAALTGCGKAASNTSTDNTISEIASSTDESQAKDNKDGNVDLFEGVTVDVTDAALTLQAKAIYMYFLQAADGKKEVLLKSPEDIQAELCIGVYQYYSHLHRLIDNGYIRIEHTRSEHQRFGACKCVFLKF